MKSVTITKASGESAPFSPEKLRLSLERSGAETDLIDIIVSEVERQLYEGITTKKIYKLAFRLLRVKTRPAAARYKLKKAIAELGPTGYPFEQFIGELLKHQGYEVNVGVILQGQCVSHEVDVVAENGNRKFMIECKFHSDDNRKCGVQVPLYVQSRFLDIRKQWEKQAGNDEIFHQGWVVTNTRFSTEAIQYGSCVGLKLIGWDHPREGSLKEMIDASGLHPITCLSALNKKEKQMLLSKGIVLCRQLFSGWNGLAEANIELSHRAPVKKELNSMLQGSND